MNSLRMSHDANMRTDSLSDPLLVADGLTKRYAVTVLDHVTLDLRSGEIHALLGANGAGKSTLCRIIAGLVAPTSGQMRLNGEPYQPTGKKSAEKAGVQIVQQELSLIPSLTVAENIMLGRMPNRFGIVNRTHLRRRAQQALDRLKIQDICPQTITAELGVGHKQMIEIASAIDRECRVLILDEPTAALTAGETKILFEMLQRLRDQGIGMFYISHRLHEVERMSDRVSILRDGKWICTHSTKSTNAQQMVDLMTGEAHHTNGDQAFRSFSTGKSALRVDSLSRGEAVRNVSLHVDRGERLGIAGLVGAGRTELLRLIFAADCGDSGRLHLDGDAIGRPLFSHPSEAVANGVAMVSEDRKEDGLLLSQSISVNASLTSLREQFSSLGLLHEHSERQSTKSMMEQLDTRFDGIEQPAGTLSGGNQQKVAISKWLFSEFNIFLFDEPTRGIDVAARRRIYELLESLAASGKAIVIVSSDLDELMENCDRIIVMCGGELTGTFHRGEWTEDALMQAAFSHHRLGADT